MDRKAVEAALKQLQQEHAQSRYRDPQSQAQAQQLIADLERQLQHPDSAEARADLHQRATAAIREFEVEHPQLTAALTQIVSAFSSMGI